MKRLKKTQNFKNTSIEITDAIHTPMYFCFNEDNRELHVRVDHSRLADEEPYDKDDFEKEHFDNLPIDLQQHIQQTFDKINKWLLTREKYIDGEEIDV